TFREESVLWGARYVNKSDLGGAKVAFNFDGSCANHVIIGAVGADRWEAEIFGRASHAGGAPENGISATLILAEALSRVHGDGYFGKVTKKHGSGTSNVGPVGGPDGGPAGDATNVVTDYVKVYGESRSHNAKFFREITAAYKAALNDAASKVKNADGKKGRVRFSARTDYHPFLMKQSQPAVKHAIAAVEAIGLAPEVRVANGGLDANWLVRHGIPTVTFGAGQNGAHTVEEWINLVEFGHACDVAMQLATG
ncbi:MAG: M20/M25/M40 family metallo-hydrolase, partial [Hyphomicrobiaceae bacterium]